MNLERVDHMIILREITYLSIVLRIALAALMGGIFGWEREMKNRAAGLRTYMLVCVGSCMIMLTNQYIFQVFATGDPVRMGAQVVSGIGFLGAGTIVVTKNNRIRGLTTAAGLWAVAAVGLSLGIGFYEAAIVGGLLIFLILTIMHNLDNHIHKRVRRFELYAEVDCAVSIGKIVKDIRSLGIETEGIQLDREYSAEHGIRALLITVKKPAKLNKDELIAKLTELEGMVTLEELR